MSYSKFIYSCLNLSNKVLTKDSKIKVSVKIKNDSNRIGEEIVQLYIQDLVAKVVRPVKELKAFQKVVILPKQEKEVIFEISEDMLKFWDENLRYDSENGDFKVYIGTNSEDTLFDTFSLKK